MVNHCEHYSNLVQRDGVMFVINVGLRGAQEWVT